MMKSVSRDYYEKDVYHATQERKGNGDEFIAIYPEEGIGRKRN